MTIEDISIRFYAHFADVSYIKMPIGWKGNFGIASDDEREEIITRIGLPILSVSSAIKLYKSNQGEVLILGALMLIEPRIKNISSVNSPTNAKCQSVKEVDGHFNFFITSSSASPFHRSPCYTNSLPSIRSARNRVLREDWPVVGRNIYELFSCLPIKINDSRSSLSFGAN